MGKEPDYGIAVKRETPAEWKQLVHGGQFAGKLLGKSSSGGLLMGWAKLP